jgi:hypothetical protein
MKSRNKWGGVIWAGVFAAFAIGLSVLSYSSTHGKGGNALIPAGSSGSPADMQPLSTPLTSAISADLYSNYAALSSQNGSVTPEERDAMLAELVKKHVANPQVVPNISLADLNVQNSASLDAYAKLLGIILNQSSQVKEYELAVFTKTITAGNANGTPALALSADLYTRIAAALLVMEVPRALAPQHLEAVKSVGALAKAVENMAEWQGDPIEALSEMDTFNKAEDYVEASVSNLADAIETLKKKS